MNSELAKVKKWCDINKLSIKLSIQQLKRIYYNLIYPYISYSILVWGSVCKTYLKKIQVKQNHIVRLTFCAKTFGKEKESARPLLNLLDILTVDNIYCLEVLKFSLTYLMIYFNMLEICIDTT